MRRPLAWIYVLHFDAPLCHARHYIGATLNLRARLTRHAQGRGCRITRALAEAGIGWQVGGLFQVSPVALWEAERQAKAMHQGACLCDLCGGRGRLLDAIRVDLDHITFPTTSKELRVK
jgi:predicted GIY-YIG superfamily endonuclease